MADYAFSVLEITPEVLESLRSKIGTHIMHATDQRGMKFLNRFETGEIVNVDTRKIDAGLTRSYEQLGLYWSACDLVADNTDVYEWNTKEKVNIQCKIYAKLITGFTAYADKDGNSQIQLILGSISYSELKHLDACMFFDKAFNAMAEHLNITVDELITETKNRMLNGVT